MSYDELKTQLKFTDTTIEDCIVNLQNKLQPSYIWIGYCTQDFWTIEHIYGLQRSTKSRISISKDILPYSKSPTLYESPEIIIQHLLGIKYNKLLVHPITLFNVPRVNIALFIADAQNIDHQLIQLAESNLAIIYYSRYTNALIEFNNRFFKNIANEIQQPLSQILAINNTVHKPVMDITTTITDSMDVIKMESGTFKIQVAQFNIKKLWEHICAVVKSICTIECSMELSEPDLYGDINRLKQMFINIIQVTTASEAAVVITSEFAENSEMDSSDTIVYQVNFHISCDKSIQLPPVTHNIFPIVQNNKWYIANTIATMHGGSITINDRDILVKIKLPNYIQKKTVQTASYRHLRDVKVAVVIKDEEQKINISRILSKWQIVPMVLSPTEFKRVGKPNLLLCDSENIIDVETPYILLGTTSVGNNYCSLPVVEDELIPKISDLIYNMKPPQIKEVLIINDNLGEAMALKKLIETHYKCYCDITTPPKSYKFKYKYIFIDAYMAYVDTQDAYNNCTNITPNTYVMYTNQKPAYTDFAIQKPIKLEALNDIFNHS